MRGSAFKGVYVRGLGWRLCQFIPTRRENVSNLTLSKRSNRQLAWAAADELAYSYGSPVGRPVLKSPDSKHSWPRQTLRNGVESPSALQGKLPESW